MVEGKQPQESSRKGSHSKTKIDFDADFIEMDEARRHWSTEETKDNTSLAALFSGEEQIAFE